MKRASISHLWQKPIKALGRLFESSISPLLPTKLATRLEQSNKAWTAFSIVLGGYLIAFVYYYANGVYLERGYPYNTFLFIPSDRFNDYFNMLEMCKRLDPYHDYTRSGYPPFANLLFYIFSQLPDEVGLLIFILVPLFFALYFGKIAFANFDLKMRIPLILMLIPMGLPFLFAIDRANVELWIYICIGLFLFYYDSRKRILQDLAAISVGFAIALKLFPVLLLGLYIKDRKWKSLATAFAAAALLTLWAGSMFPGGAAQALKDWREMMKLTGDTVMIDTNFGRNSLSLHYAIFLPLRYFSGEAVALRFVPLSNLLSFTALAGVCSAVMFLPLTLWEASTALIAMMCVYPFLSGDYRAIHLGLPMLLFIKQETHARSVNLVILCIFSLVLIPKNYLILFPETAPGDVGIASIVDPALLLLLVVLILSSAATRKSSPQNTNKRISYHASVRTDSLSTKI